jgi:hypothetical protein
LKIRPSAAVKKQNGNDWLEEQGISLIDFLRAVLNGSGSLAAVIDLCIEQMISVTDEDWDSISSDAEFGNVIDSTTSFELEQIKKPLKQKVYQRSRTRFRVKTSCTDLDLELLKSWTERVSKCIGGGDLAIAQSSGSFGKQYGSEKGKRPSSSTTKRASSSLSASKKKYT